MLRITTKPSQRRALKDWMQPPPYITNAELHARRSNRACSLTGQAPRPARGGSDLMRKRCCSSNCIFAATSSADCIRLLIAPSIPAGGKTMRCGPSVITRSARGWWKPTWAGLRPDRTEPV